MVGYGISQEEASLDAICVDRHYQHRGIGEQLIHEFVERLRTVGVKKNKHLGRLE